MLLLGAIRARSDHDGAKQAFGKALSLDRKAILDLALATQDAVEAFKAAQQELPPEIPVPTGPPPPSAAVTPPDGAPATQL